MKKWIFGLCLCLFISFQAEEGSASSLSWEGMEVRNGQIGKVTITKPINLWKRTNSGIEFSRILYPGESYRVYKKDNEYGGQFGVGDHYYITNMIGYVDYKQLPQEVKSLMDCDKDCLVDRFIQYELVETYDDFNQEVDQSIRKLPRTLMMQLLLHNITLIVTDQPITDIKQFSYLKGLVPRGWEGTGKTWDDVPGLGGGETIVVRYGYSAKGNDHGSINLELHELAHSIDHILLNNRSNSREFKDIWITERLSLFPNDTYMRDYHEEYFSEVFAMYFFSQETREQLAKYAPKTFAFIAKIDIFR